MDGDFGFGGFGGGGFGGGFDPGVGGLGAMPPWLLQQMGMQPAAPVPPQTMHQPPSMQQGGLNIVPPQNMPGRAMSQPQPLLPQLQPPTMPRPPVQQAGIPLPQARPLGLGNPNQMVPPGTPPTNPAGGAPQPAPFPTMGQLIKQNITNPLIAQYGKLIPGQELPIDAWKQQHANLYNSPMVPDSIRAIVDTALKPQMQQGPVPLPMARPPGLGQSPIQTPPITNPPTQNPGTFHFLQGMQSRYGEVSPEQLATDADRIRSAVAPQSRFDPIPISADNPTAQLAAIRAVAKPGDTVLGFSGGANTAAKLNMPGVRTMEVGAPNLPGNINVPGPHMDLVHNLANQMAGVPIPRPRPDIPQSGSETPPVNTANLPYSLPPQPPPVDTGPQGAANRAAGLDDPFAYLSQYGAHSSVLNGAPTRANIHSGPIGAATGFDAELASRLATAGREYQARTGKDPRYGESDRGSDVQSVYWQEHLTKGLIAAPPGTSRHQRGLAMDIPEGDFLNWMRKNGRQFGVNFPVRGDWGHAQLDPSFKGSMDTGFIPGDPRGYQTPTQMAAAPRAPAAPPHYTTLPPYGPGNMGGRSLRVPVPLANPPMPSGRPSTVLPGVAATSGGNPRLAGMTQLAGDIPTPDTLPSPNQFLRRPHTLPQITVRAPYEGPQPGLSAGNATSPYGGLQPGLSAGAPYGARGSAPAVPGASAPGIPARTPGALPWAPLSPEDQQRNADRSEREQRQLQQWQFQNTLINAIRHAGFVRRNRRLPPVDMSGVYALLGAAQPTFGSLLKRE